MVTWSRPRSLWLTVSAHDHVAMSSRESHKVYRDMFWGEIQGTDSDKEIPVVINYYDHAGQPVKEQVLCHTLSIKSE